MSAITLGEHQIEALHKWYQSGFGTDVEIEQRSYPGVIGADSAFDFDIIVRQCDSRAIIRTNGTIKEITP